MSTKLVSVPRLLRKTRLGRVAPYLVLSHGLSDKPVLGCGSNVVDHIYSVKVVPRAGQKGFFLSPFKALDKKLIGGVTLNHLSWAALGGVHTGLLALQGEDDLGHFIRTNLKKLKVDTSFIKVNSDFSTSQCHVFIQEDGERSIVMAPASTSVINAQAVQEHFGADIDNHASMVTTEISQVPLSGVLALLKAARKANVLSVLDLDVPPKVAVEEAMLGTLEEVVECVRNADILKPSQEAAIELLPLMAASEGKEKMPLHEVTKKLVEACGCKLLAITNGGDGSVLANREFVVDVRAPSVSKVIDTTGAGDAFLGGLIIGLKASGVPQSEEELRAMGKIANAYGAACTQTVGGVPVDTSHATIQRYLADLAVTAPSIPTSYLPSSMPTEPSLESNEEALPSNFAESISRDAEGLQAMIEGGLEGASQFVDILEQCPGQILLSGIGKSGLVAQRFSGSLSSIGISSQYVHATEWAHGDLGKVTAGRDVVIFISHSGNTGECVTAAKQLLARGITTAAITRDKDSMLAKLCVGCLVYSHDLQEPFGCFPTTSLVIQDVVLNGLVSELISRKGITKTTFINNHPGGSIGAAA